MNKIFPVFALFLALVLGTGCSSHPKYVFYFIGDGMGLNQVHLTESYLASMEGKVGVDKLCFSQFPVSTYATTYSKNRLTTDSSASGTALSTGNKTNNYMMGVDPEGNPMTNIAEKAQNSGRRVGILTSTTINHATPGAFIAHQKNRGMTREIAEELINRNYDFYAGSGVDNECTDQNGNPAESMIKRFEEAGYTVCGDMEEYKEKSQGSDKLMILPGEGKRVMYRIDRDALEEDGQKNCLVLKDLVSAAMDFLMKEPRKGFFLMAEGAHIDHTCHSNDAVGAIREILDFNEAVELAYDFYSKHPKKTLIVVTADHETGGLVFKPSTPSDLCDLQYQTKSLNELSSDLRKKISESPKALSWEEVKAFLSDELGLWTKVQISKKEEKELYDIYESTIAKKKSGSVIDLYSDNAVVVSSAVRILNNAAKVYWTTSSHTSGYVPVYAIGKGSELFNHRTDNAEIPQLISKAANYR